MRRGVRAAASPSRHPAEGIVETVSFYSYKGGVGRSLLITNTARFLSLSGRRVVVLDLDLEAPGLLYKLGDAEAREAAARGERLGVVDYLADLFETGAPPASLDPYLVTVPTPPDLDGSIRLLPAGAAPHPRYWERLEALGELRRAREPDLDLAMVLLDLAGRIEEELTADYLLIDARTGVTELGGLATTALADRVVCLTLASDECLDGTRAALDALRGAERPPGRGPVTVEVLLSRVGSMRYGDKEQFATSLGVRTLSAVLHHDHEGVEREPRVGTTHIAERRSGLLMDTAEWIAKTFGRAGDQHGSAALRMRAVASVVRDLTRERPMPTPDHEGGAPWRRDQMRDGVTFTSYSTTRFADIALYSEADDRRRAPTAVPEMIVEYIGDSPPEPIAAVWLRTIGVKAVCLLVAGPDGAVVQRTFTWRWGWSDVRASQRRDLPEAQDFGALDDVGDASSDALVDAIRRGHSRYAYQLVRNWVGVTHATLHGGSPWRPREARRILDGLSSATDGHYLLRVAGGDWLGDEHWGGMSSGRVIAEQVAEGLLAPLYWRTGLEDAAAYGRDKRRVAYVAPVHAFVASHLMGLRYDPEGQFRAEAPAVADESSDDAYAIYGRRGLDGLEMTLDLDATIGAEALARIVAALQLSASDAPPTPLALTQALRARAMLVTVGVLGAYDADSSTLRFYREHIAAAAATLGVATRSLERVVHLHLAVLAYAHLGRDADGRMWESFALPRRVGELIPTGGDLTTLVQCFVARLLDRLGDRDLRDAFEGLSDAQPLPYRAWRRLAAVSLEDLRAWLMTMRRGHGAIDAVRLALFP